MNLFLFSLLMLSSSWMVGLYLPSMQGQDHLLRTTMVLPHMAVSDLIIFAMKEASISIELS